MDIDPAILAAARGDILGRYVFHAVVDVLCVDHPSGEVITSA